MKRENLDKWVRKAIYLVTCLIIILEPEYEKKFIIVTIAYVIYVVKLILQRKKQSPGKNMSPVQLPLWMFIGRLIILTAILLSFLFKEVYFIFGLISIAFFLYKTFESIGDLTEKIFPKEPESQNLWLPLVISALKLPIWLIGYLVFLQCFFAFIINYITSYSVTNDNLVIWIINTHPDIIPAILFVILSLIMAFFIIDFLRKMMFTEIKPLNLKNMSRLEYLVLFSKIAIVITFTDLMYGLLYLSYSTTKVIEIISFEKYIEMLLECTKAFHYAFCLHFAIPMPSTKFYQELDSAVKQTNSLQIIQFFHFCLNKIVDITILAYMASLVLSAMGVKREEKKEA